MFPITCYGKEDGIKYYFICDDIEIEGWITITKCFGDGKGRKPTGVDLGI
jgi:hypothetical protein